ncbi:MAG: hypothetical protein AABY76_04220, partial [Planctomycetota bacterium]
MDNRLYDLNKMVISDPELGYNWHIINQALLNKASQQHAISMISHTSPISSVTTGSDKMINAAARKVTAIGNNLFLLKSRWTSIAHHHKTPLPHPPSLTTVLQTHSQPLPPHPLHRLNNNK